MLPSLTTAVPGKINLTIAKFYNSGQDDIVYVRLINSATTGDFFTSASLNGTTWTEVALPLIGDFGIAMADIARSHILAISEQGRSTNLTIDTLYAWLTGIWPSVQTSFVASVGRQLPYTMSFMCPSAPPRALAVDLPNASSNTTPSSITSLQVHVPSAIPYSDIYVDDPTTQATAYISYPPNASQVLSGSAVIFIAAPSGQTTSDHSFKWYLPGMPVMAGLQIGLTLPFYTTNTNMPVTLVVTNLTTGISKSSTIFITVIA